MFLFLSGSGTTKDLAEPDVIFSYGEFILKRDLRDTPLIFPVPISFLKLLLNQKILKDLSASATDVACSSRRSFDAYFLINTSDIINLILF
jgi:hypothetical protein